MKVTTLILALAFAGCKGKDDKAKTGGAERSAASSEAMTSSAAATSAATSSAAADDKGPHNRRKMANCPSAVKGASTTIEMQDGKAVVIKVVGGTDDSKKAIAERGKLLAEKLGKVAEVGGGHTGKRNYGGGVGRCPQIIPDTKLAFKATDDGAEFTLTAEKDLTVEKIKAEADRRLKNLMEAADGAHMHGSGKGGGEGSGESKASGKGDGTGQHGAKAGGGAGAGDSDAEGDKDGESEDKE